MFVMQVYWVGPCLGGTLICIVCDAGVLSGAVPGRNPDV